jgi:hypothetical protein
MSSPQGQEAPKKCPPSGRHCHGMHIARRSLSWGMLATGFVSLVWFLVRVVPKPSRAVYPCQRAALPLAGGFVLWLMGAVGSIAAWRYARALWRSRWYMALACGGIGAAAGLLALVYMPEEAVMATYGTANAPIGTPRGIHPGRVVWVHDPAATQWLGTNDLGKDIGDGYWWQSSHTDQVITDRMMSAAIRRLSGEATDAGAWDALFRFFNQTHGKGAVPYQVGEKIVIKANLVTAWRNFVGIVDADGNQKLYLGWVNTSPQMILSLLRQLVNVVGVAQGDITVGDTTTYFPNHYWNHCHGEFPDVHYMACSGSWGRDPAVSSAGQTCETRVYWSTAQAAGSPPDYVPVAYAQADYLINFACLKGHSSGITLCAKNHYGSLIRLPSEAGFYNLHYSLPNAGWSPGSGHYRALVDTMGHSKLGGNTLLYLIDGLYGGYRSEGRPYLWQMEPFNGDWPSSLFASQDPVAIDSVGYDFLLTEWPHVVADPGLEGGAEDYLHEAALASQPPSQTLYQPDGEGHPLSSSLGVHEHWNNPHDKQYSVNLGIGPGIELVRIEPPSSDFDLDGDVDLGDFAVFQACFNGPNRPAAQANCQAADLDHDTDVDLADFGIFQGCFNGPNRTPACY